MAPTTTTTPTTPTTPTSDAARQYTRAHGEDFRRDPHELLRIPSLSGDPDYAAEVRLARIWPPRPLEREERDRRWLPLYPLLPWAAGSIRPCAMS
ncbi:MAG TPA: hypothetical protein VIG30_14035 [Ktedonobacterales bacterium]